MYVYLPFWRAIGDLKRPITNQTGLFGDDGSISAVSDSPELNVKRLQKSFKKIIP